MRIGLALSGGGIRATIFHLGALARLAQQSLIENITFLSTVSGGSLAVALVRACSGNGWPGSDTVLQHTIPRARRLLTAHGLDRAYLQYMLLSPWTVRHGRAAALARSASRLLVRRRLVVRPAGQSQMDHQRHML